MENIKKEKNNHVCLIISFVLMIVVEIYSFLVSNIFNVFIFTSILFYFLEQKNKKKQMNYLIQCCDAIIEQKDFSIIDGESKESLLSNKLFGKLLLNDDFKNKLSDRWSELRYNQIIDTDNLMDEFKGNFNYLNNNAVYEREMIAWQNYYTLDQTQLEYMENWISARIAYLDKTFNLKQIPVSIENDKNISEISIFPNPASDYLQIKANTQKQLNYNIYSLDGKYVKSDTFKGKTEIELSNINNGTYIIVLKGSNFHKTLKFSVTK